MNLDPYDAPAGTTMFHGTFRVPDYLMKGETKTCAKCGRTLPIGAFARDKRVKSGHRGSCRACSTAYRRTRRAMEKKGSAKTQISI